MERGLFDEETAPEELTQVRMGKIVRDRYPDLSKTDQEAVRQHAIAAMNLTQQGKAAAAKMDAGRRAPGQHGARSTACGNTRWTCASWTLILIDRINPFGEAYAILSKSMNEATLKQLAEIIAARKIQMTPDEARELARRALKFKNERGRLPSMTSPDAWEKRMAEGVAFLARMKAEAARG